MMASDARTKFKLVEREAGEVLHAEQFECSPFTAEKLQERRWNEHYAHGEARVSSRLYRLHYSRWWLYLSLGA
jgi:hypothetical protein